MTYEARVGTNARRDEAGSAAADSLARRYRFKLLASASAMVTALGVEALSSRFLGPAEYGEYYFLQQFFAQLLAFLSGGTSTAFVTRLARRPKSPGFVIFYMGWLLVLLAIADAFILAATWLGWDSRLWPGSRLLYVHLGCLTAFLVFVGREMTGLGDARGLTVRFEIVRIWQRLISLALLVALVAAGLLNLVNLFAYTCIANLGLAAALFYITRGGSDALFRIPTRPSTSGFIAYFYNYSAPVFVFYTVSTFAMIFDRWLLQHAAGSAQQGYFSLATQISTVISLFTSALAPLLMREMSLAHARADRARMASLYQKLLPGLAFAAAVPSCFLACEAGTITLVVGGPSFADAKWVLALMALVPIYAAYGYVSASIYFATGQTALFRNIGTGAFVVGSVMSIILVGPSSWFAWNMGANGLAAKSLAAAVLMHNAFMFFNCRYFGLRYRTVLLQQAGTILPLLLLAGISRGIGGTLFGQASLALTVAGLLLEGTIYLMLIAALMAIVPSLAGLDRAQVRGFILRCPRRKIAGL